MQRPIFIIYVTSQEKSTMFYQSVFNKQPVLNVPGMTEFEINDNTLFGIMEEKGIKRLLPDIPNPADATGIPRSELYLITDNVNDSLNRVKLSGGKIISELSERSWGDKVGYAMDPDGHIIAFPERKNG